MSSVLDVENIQRVVAELGMQYGADRIYLFGSYARGDADSDSDIDLRIDRGRVRGLAMGGLLWDLKDALGKEVDLISTKCLSQNFLDSIQGEEILLYDEQRNEQG